jgi:raffinose/stachyose/melibiose transport system permease protein
MDLSLFGRQRTVRAALPLAVRRRGRPREGLGTILLFLPPALMIFTLFVVLPIGESAWFSLFDWNGYGTPQHFVGLRNYIRLFSFPPFRTALLNNGMIIAMSVLIQLPVAIAAGALLSGRGRGVVFMRLVFFCLTSSRRLPRA